MTAPIITHIAYQIAQLDPAEFTMADTNYLYDAIMAKNKQASAVRAAEIKSRLKEGQTVSFIRSKTGETIIGKLEKIKRTRAIVRTPQGGYDVIISELTILDEGV